MMRKGFLSLLSQLFPNYRKPKKTARRQRLNLEPLEERLTPSAGNILVSSGGFGATQLLQNYSPTGTLLTSQTIPQVGDSDARDLAVSQNGDIQVFNGTFTPYMSTLSGSTWSTPHSAGGVR